MAKISEMFAGRYLKTDEIPPKGIDVTIAHAQFEDVGAGKNAEEKLVLYTEELDKGLPLNKTNALEIAELLGLDDSDDWGGHKICLFRGKTEFQGKRTDCVRVRRARGSDSAIRSAATEVNAQS